MSTIKPTGGRGREHLEYKQEYHLLPAVDAYKTAVSFGVMSKAYALSGLRIGWITARATSSDTARTYATQARNLAVSGEAFFQQGPHEG